MRRRPTPFTIPMPVVSDEEVLDKFTWGTKDLIPVRKQVVYRWEGEDTWDEVTKG